MDAALKRPASETRTLINIIIIMIALTVIIISIIYIITDLLFLL